MKTNLFLKKIGATLLMAAFTSGAMAQQHTTTTTARPPAPPVNYNHRGPATPQEGMPPVMGQPQNGNGSLSTPGYKPPTTISPLSQGFVTNGMNNQRRQMFAATNPPPNVTSFPFTNANRTFPNNNNNNASPMNPP